MKELTLPALILAAAMASVPAWAQTTNPPPSPAPVPAHHPATPAATNPEPSLAPVPAHHPATPAATNPAPSPTPQRQTTENTTHMGIATIKPTGIAPSKRNPLLTDNGDVRIGKLIGSDVYNKDDKKVGGVDGVVASRSGQLQIVIATNKKKVAVPWDKVQFGDAKLNSDNKVLMPGATEQSLNSMPTFHYQNKNGH
ncbi:MAG: PRC-barrel domain-containing protein [Acetobacteraceae bacterium]